MVIQKIDMNDLLKIIIKCIEKSAKQHEILLCGYGYQPPKHIKYIDADLFIEALKKEMEEEKDLKAPCDCVDCNDHEIDKNSIL